MSSWPVSPKPTAEQKGGNMSGPVGGEKDVYDEINITPMLDLAYVLLIIFIILTTATVQGIKVNLPKASAQPSLAQSKTKAISITADGTIYLDTFPVSMSELENLLRQYKAATPDLPVIIKADSGIQYQRVVDVLDLLERLQITQLGLVTQKIVK
jgi:biopolymer transport protein ExbD